MSLASDIAQHLPYLRRYARALTGNQTAGDAYVRACLEAIISAPDEFPADTSPRVGLYHVFQKIWSGVEHELFDPQESGSVQEKMTQQRLSAITPLNRQALLLSSMEGFTQQETAQILSSSEEDISNMISAALAEIDKQIATDVLIIEDEPIISMDLEAIVQELGHNVSGIAVTREEALKVASTHRPGLVLADIQLADGSSGIDAVKDILEAFPVPVIFITAFPERLLTGDRPEPTFLISKPFQRSTVKAAISQALFFNSTAKIPA